MPLRLPILHGHCCSDPAKLESLATLYAKVNSTPSEVTDSERRTVLRGPTAEIEAANVAEVTGGQENYIWRDEAWVMSDDLRAARVNAVVAVETKQERLMGFNVMRMATIAPLRMEECFAIVEEKKRVKAPRPAHWVQKLKEDKVPWGFAFIRTRSSRGGDFMKYLTWLEYPDKSKKRRPSTPLPIKGAEGLPRRTIEQWTEVDASASGPEEFRQMRKTSQYFRDRQFRTRWVWAYDPESRKLVRGKPQLPKTDGDRYDDCVKAYWDDMWTWIFAVRPEGEIDMKKLWEKVQTMRDQVWRAGTKSGGVSHGVFVIREKRKLGDVGVF